MYVQGDWPLISYSHIYIYTYIYIYWSRISAVNHLEHTHFSAFIIKSSGRLRHIKYIVAFRTRKRPENVDRQKSVSETTLG